MLNCKVNIRKEDFRCLEHISLRSYTEKRSMASERECLTEMDEKCLLAEELRVEKGCLTKN